MRTRAWSRNGRVVDSIVASRPMLEHAVAVNQTARYRHDGRKATSLSQRAEHRRRTQYNTHRDRFRPAAAFHRNLPRLVRAADSKQKRRGEC